MIFHLLAEKNIFFDGITRVECDVTGSRLVRYSVRGSTYVHCTCCPDSPLDLTLKILQNAHIKIFKHPCNSMQIILKYIIVLLYDNNQYIVRSGTNIITSRQTHYYFIYVN